MDTAALVGKFAGLQIQPPLHCTDACLTSIATSPAPPVISLPPELLTQILAHAGVPTLLTCERVCKAWSTLIRSNTAEIWKLKLQAVYPCGCLPVLYGHENWRDAVCLWWAWRQPWQTYLHPRSSPRLLPQPAEDIAIHPLIKAEKLPLTTNGTVARDLIDIYDHPQNDWHRWYPIYLTNGQVLLWEEHGPRTLDNIFHPADLTNHPSLEPILLDEEFIDPNFTDHILNRPSMYLSDQDSHLKFFDIATNKLLFITPYSNGTRPLHTVCGNVHMMIHDNPSPRYSICRITHPFGSFEIDEKNEPTTGSPYYFLNESILIIMTGTSLPPTSSTTHTQQSGTQIRSYRISPQTLLAKVTHPEKFGSCTLGRFYLFATPEATSTAHPNSHERNYRIHLFDPATLALLHTIPTPSPHNFFPHLSNESCLIFDDTKWIPEFVSERHLHHAPDYFGPNVYMIDPFRKVHVELVTKREPYRVAKGPGYFAIVMEYDVDGKGKRTGALGKRVVYYREVDEVLARESRWRYVGGRDGGGE